MRVQRTRRLTIAAVLGLTFAVVLFAKGETIRITITGGGLTTPIEITGANVVQRFRVWSGPGTSSNEAIWLNVDSSPGAARPPQGLPEYEVSFVTTSEHPGAYRVRYVFDPGANRGYVYIPGKKDPEYRDNVGLILRFVEGGWFHASKQWESLVAPLLANARNAH